MSGGKKEESDTSLDGIWIRILLIVFLDEKECRCFITGLEPKLMSRVSNSVGGMAVVTSGPEHAENDELRIFLAK